MTGWIVLALIFLSGFAVGLAVRSRLRGFLAISAVPTLISATAIYLYMTSEEARRSSFIFPSTVDLMTAAAIYLEIVILAGWILGQFVQLVNRRGWLDVSEDVED